MSEFTMSEIIEMVVSVWKSLAKGVLSIILLFTAPLWLIPYTIYNKLKYGIWF